ncbi:MAG: DUF4065 domain-containing protein [Roseburia sp.]|nr:DUF4065 domain-containing protein [Ruminococcus sp.]MCM1155453.1 DUF4065 domain-containing protein [Roseburia sp.]MCM1241899.1 DUF4065 domain-containing protein [Roseburia sp.]
MDNLLCLECGFTNEYEFRQTTRKYEGDGYSFTLEVKVPFCKKCGNPIEVEEIEEEIAERANGKIRECKGIIKKEEIISILSRYNVSQKFLSRLLGWGEITLTRYISGGYTPNAANSEKIKALNDPYVFQQLLDEKIEKAGEEFESENLVNKLQDNINRNIGEIEKRSGKVYKVVNWFLGQSTDENPVTHLALQKLLYFSQCWNKIWNHAWLFDDDCEAWVHGAVYRNVYNNFKKFKYKPLPKVKRNEEFTEAETTVLQFVKEYYFDIYTAKSLEMICHLEEPYQSAREGYEKDASCGEVINKNVIEAYYTRIAEKYDISKETPAHVKKYLNDLLA